MAIDYYEILNVPPSADQAAIKSAYRKLAHQYHPDKNPENKFTDARFELIKEAYETLINPQKKEKYLQERWLVKANALQFETGITTPEDLLKQILATSEKIYRMDIYRMNREAIITELNSILTPERVNMLNDFNEASINNAIVKEFLQMVNILPATRQTAFLQTLQQINSSYITDIRQKEEELSGKIFWETWRPAFIILLVILLCILIWGTSINKY